MSTAESHGPVSSQVLDQSPAQQLQQGSVSLWWQLPMSQVTYVLQKRGQQPERGSVLRSPYRPWEQPGGTRLWAVICA